MAEHKAGNTVVLTGTITEVLDNVAVVKIDKAVSPADTIIVRLGTLPDDEPASEADRIREAMAEAQDHPGRTITR